MLKKLRIQNFKCWWEEDTVDMQMAPLTVFFGTNSSGKSSIGQFLMMLKQTTESADRKAVLNLGDRASAAQLGSYEDMIYAHDSSRDLKFAYEWDCKGTLEIQDSPSKKRYPYNAMHFSAEIGMNEKAKRMFVKNFSYQLGNEPDMLKVGMSAERGSLSNYNLDADKGYTPTRPTRGRGWPLDAPVHFYAFPDVTFARYRNADFVADLNLQHQKLFASMSYLGPLRKHAERIYILPGSEPESVGYSGEHTIPAMLAAQGKHFNFIHGKRKKSFSEIIVAALKEMKLADDLKVKPLSTDQQQAYEVKVATKYSKTRGSTPGDSLPDVGIGVAQVLPVLVQCFYAPPGSIIIMEQPEIHLHPSAQSALADVMIDVIRSRENGVDRNIQLIIETHSEHFLRRLQLRIAEKEIEREKVEAYFVEPKDGRAHLEHLSIDVFGDIGNWPKNFFGDEFGDIAKKVEAKRQRLRTQAQANRR
ncbi:MAG: conserved hypothetical protein [Arenicellales bacterium IbO2]|nr:DUF3696 domain-containing protein [Gammaproteobacteria bacterium]MDA7961572.1 DUF3696 domain-containing protein [Gammaproteobacteria bacterium]MDA8024644.1 DUF3696 domain-containing protein [Gammaproteobacteria bacterium]MDA8030788.1 DUF3696 domain-containing protein [Alphaproteobacteria bacterium]CAJ2376689.1 MAG: conserved hypothetical protein [Arenicellales bacterium IbO2]